MRAIANRGVYRSFLFCLLLIWWRHQTLVHSWDTEAFLFQLKKIPWNYCLISTSWKIFTLSHHKRQHILIFSDRSLGSISLRYEDSDWSLREQVPSDYRVSYDYSYWNGPCRRGISLPAFGSSDGNWFVRFAMLAALELIPAIGRIVLIDSYSAQSMHRLLPFHSTAKALLWG